MHILDGQQRITALWRSLTDDYDDLRVFVRLIEADSSDSTEGSIDDEEDEEETGLISVERRWRNKAGQRQPAWAHNDWQYPDPYFGILEIEKSHDGATARRYRGEVNPTPRSSRFPAPSAWQAPAGEPAGPAAATPAPVTRPRWRNRWRR
jgi:hypothetical protein